jgi:hypothetical protein
MAYFVLIFVSFMTTGLAWRRIFSHRYSLVVRMAYLLFTLVPIAGPVFYLMIDPPESSPATVKPEEFWQPGRGAGRVWPSFAPLMESLRAMFRSSKSENE